MCVCVGVYVGVGVTPPLVLPLRDLGWSGDGQGDQDGAGEVEGGHEEVPYIKVL